MIARASLIEPDRVAPDGAPPMRPFDAGVAVPTGGAGTRRDIHEPHVAAGLPPDRRIDYLTAVLAVVAAGRPMGEAEWAAWCRLADALAPPGAAPPTAPTFEAARVGGIVGSFRQDPYRYALLTDALRVAHAGRRVGDDQTRHLAELVESLGVPTAHAVLLARYVEESAVADRRKAWRSGFGRTLARGLLTTTRAKRGGRS